MNFPPGVENSILAIFENVAARNPDGVALVFGDREMTYRELNEGANRLAHALIISGVVPESLVGVLLPKSLEVPLVLLAILKAGGAYVPIDPAYPGDRVAFMLEDSGIPVLVTDRQRLKEFPVPEGLHTFLIDEMDTHPTSGPVSNPGIPVEPDNLAYVIYTSGSSGQPKGVLIEHAGLSNAIQFGVEKFALAPGDRVLHFVSFSFDAATSHLFMALCSGATSVLTTPERFSPDPAGFLRRERITHAPLPASVLETIPAGEFPSLRVVTVGAEACSAELAKRWASRVGFHNMYGPTESTIFVTTWAFEPGYSVPPIGRPVSNAELYILDEHLEPVARGETGELHVGGLQLARGYLNQPQLTRERFIENPFGNGRLYKTGDQARQLPDGNFVFCGRMDEQVKVHGYRIEPGEIEEALRRSPGVKQAVVVVQDQLLCAYVVPALVDELMEDSLRAFLMQILPEFMVPSRIFPIPEIPLTPEGKTDRKALSRKVVTVAKPTTEVAPVSALEQALVHIWQGVLGNEYIGITDNFFDMGGDSIAVMKILTQVRSVLKIDLPMRILFEAQTISGLVEAMRPFASSEVLEQNAENFLREK